MQNFVVLDIGEPRGRPAKHLVFTMMLLFAIAQKDPAWGHSASNRSNGDSPVLTYLYLHENMSEMRNGYSKATSEK